MKRATVQRPKPTETSIPSYALYGTQGLADDPGFLHIETLAISSRPFAGRIRAHRHRDLFQILMLQQGEARIEVDQSQFNLSQPTVITLPPGYVHGFEFFDGTDGYILTLALPLLSLADDGSGFSFMALDPLVIPLSGQNRAAAQIQNLIQMLALELTEPDNWRTEICGHLVRALLIWLQRATQDLDKSKADQSLSTQLRDFRHLVELHYLEHLDLTDYAERLQCSVATLNRHCRKHLGVTAQELIHQRLNQEARRRLSFTQRTLEQLAGELGFDDPAYFSRFFKRLNGQTPSQYRRANNFGTESP